MGRLAVITEVNYTVTFHLSTHLEPSQKMRTQGGMRTQAVLFIKISFSALIF